MVWIELFLELRSVIDDLRYVYFDFCNFWESLEAVGFALNWIYKLLEVVSGLHLDDLIQFEKY